MTENDKRKPGVYKASPEAILPYQAGRDVGRADIDVSIGL
jgi:hypothetical protein